MDKRKRDYVLATLFFIYAAIACLFASLVTDYWVEGRPEIRGANATSNKTDGQVNFGLFSGNRNLNAGIGDRIEIITGKKIDFIAMVTIIPLAYLFRLFSFILSTPLGILNKPK